MQCPHCHKFLSNRHRLDSSALLKWVVRLLTLALLIVLAVRQHWAVLGMQQSLRGLSAAVGDITERQDTIEWQQVLILKHEPIVQYLHVPVIDRERLAGLGAQVDALQAKIDALRKERAAPVQSIYYTWPRRWGR